MVLHRLLSTGINYVTFVSSPASLSDGISIKVSATINRRWWDG